MAKTASTGIVLDADLSRAFKISASKEGVLTNNGKKLSPLQETLLGTPNYDYKELAAVAYSSIVLFGKIYLQAFTRSRNGLSEWYGEDRFVDYDQLVEEGIVELVKIEGDHPLISAGEINPSNLEFKRIHLSDYVDNKGLIISCAIARASAEYRRHVKRRHFEEAYQVLFQKIYEAENSSHMSKQDRFAPLPVIESHVEKPKLAVCIDLLVHSYHNLRHVIHTSSRLGCYGRSVIPALNKVEEINFRQTEAAFRIYEIIFEEYCTFPFPRTLSSAIRLSRDKRIVDFREALSYWSRALLDGDLSAELSLRKEITKASRELKTLSTYKKIGRLITFVSLPVSIASAFAELPFGLFLLPISQAILLDSIRREKKHGWLLLGK